jgi:hypothetical protein
LAQTTPRGLRHATAGQSMARNDADTSAQLFSSGKTDLTAFVIRLLDANTSLSSAAKLE